jgi:hypothetical protein
MIQRGLPYGKAKYPLPARLLQGLHLGRISVATLRTKDLEVCIPSLRIWAAAARASRTVFGQQLLLGQPLARPVRSYTRVVRPRQSAIELMSYSGVAFWHSASLPCASLWECVLRLRLCQEEGEEDGRLHVVRVIHYADRYCTIIVRRSLSDARYLIRPRVGTAESERQ